ncbi:MAG: glycosyltransferase, partial [Acidobacteria bacterium]|nr:glycosyltransferase [Acidobacteriota bacterium]NIM62645.1 glycosyltransferase [Acidobacteriota bacterium]NIO59885.1 glycosyltransferase [Acidobacteriota bacterium]NIQ86059.1 glycosyltransferase [Acidobacteriota bacterium]NIT11575.1 glycosyltransferase [Acidobacteriota bacterium]
FNESVVIGEFYRRTGEVLRSLDGLDHEIVFVDDGSSDDSYGLLSKLARDDPRVRVIKFSRNFGHQIAITAGLDHTRG